MKKRRQLISPFDLELLRLYHLPQPTFSELFRNVDISCLFNLPLWFATAQIPAQTFPGVLGTSQILVQPNQIPSFFC